MDTREKPNSRRGAMLPLIAVALPVVVILLGFAVDLAFMQLTRLELQAVTDAAARAGASALAETDSRADARLAVIRIASSNSVAGSSLNIINTEIEFGHSELQPGGRYAFRLDQEPVNAVRVTGNRTSDSATGAVSLYFGRMIGAATFEPTSTAVASFTNIDVSLVLDRSGSMRGQKIADLKSAVGAYLDELEKTKANEQVALASYSTDARTDYLLTSDYAQIRSKVNAFDANGYTAIGQGLSQGLAAVTGAGSRSTASPMIILMTDGLHNTGEGPMTYASSAAKQGIVIHTISFGADSDQQLMSDVAKETGGRYIHADNGQELIEAFRELAAHTSQLTF